MSTRSNTVIIDAKTGDKDILYRHFDGYLSGAGVELLNYIRLMKLDFMKKGIIADSVHVKDWILKKGDEYEDAGYISGDVEYIYEVTVDAGKISVKAFTTKMFAGKNNEAIKAEDVTSELMDEWASWCEENGVVDSLEDLASVGADTEDTSIQARIENALDAVWKSEMRDAIVKRVLDIVKK